ncbi:unnamed protein product [Rotaria sp. Silwood2]|nr:unnamed protein product [Rotaria sp. Silwood2]
MYNKWTALSQFCDLLKKIGNNQQTTATATGNISDEDEENEECMNNEIGTDRSTDDGSAGVQMVDASSSDVVSVDVSAVSGDQVEDEEMTSDEYSGAMDSNAPDENTDEQGIEAPIEVAVFSRSQCCVCKEQIVPPVVTIREEDRTDRFIRRHIEIPTGSLCCKIHTVHKRLLGYHLVLDMATAERNDPVQLVRRITDVARETHQYLLPIYDYEKLPLVPLDIAIEELVEFPPNIQSFAYVAKQRCEEPADGLTQDESAAIMLYSMGWEPLDECLYFALNNTLRSLDRRKLKSWLLYLRLFLNGLFRLPSITRPVYRGVKLNLSKSYIMGKTVVWWGFSSCTTSVNVLQSEEFSDKTGTT